MGQLIRQAGSPPAPGLLRSLRSWSLSRWDRLLIRFRPPRRVLPTRAGIFALSAPFVLGIAAINSSNNLLFLVLGACLALIVVSGVVSEQMVVDVEAEIRPPTALFAGEVSTIAVTVHRRRFRAGKGPIFDIRVRERWMTRERRPEPKERLEGRVAVIDGQEGTVLAERYFPRRGLVTLWPLELLTRYPLSLLTKAKDLDVTTTVLVRPRRVEVPAELLTPSGRAIEGERSVRTGLGIDVFGLREREERDSVYRIHAMRSLSVGRDVVVETEALERPVAWLGVWNWPGAQPEAFERALELAQAALSSWDERGFVAGLRTVRQRFGAEASGTSAALDALANLGLDAAPVPPTEGLWLVPEPRAGEGRPAFGGSAEAIFVSADGGLRAGSGVSR